MIDFIHHLDESITLFINEFHSGISDAVMQMFSDRWAWVPFYIFVAYMLFRRLGWKKAVIVIISAALTVTACDQISGIIKNSIDRLRPCYDQGMLSQGLHILERRGGHFGFFSSHAANAFGFAICTVIGFRNDREHTYNAYRTWVIVWAAMISLSRVFVGKHYFGDILVGAVLGALIGYCIGAITRYVIRRYVDKAVATKVQA